MEQKVLETLQKCKSLKQLKETHVQIITNNLKDNIFILKNLIISSSQLASLDYALSVFHHTPNRNLLIHNTMIQCFIPNNSHRNSALTVYKRMKETQVTPNTYTLTFLLRCFNDFDGFNSGKAVHCEVVKAGFGSSVFVRNTLLDFYAKCCESMDFASRVFEEMSVRDVVTWNSMVGGFMSRGEVERALSVFESMPKRDVVSWNSVVSGLCKAGHMRLAYSVFERMTEKNEVSWNLMISGFIRVGDMNAAQDVFDRMPEKTVVSWTAMVTGFTTIGDLVSAGKVFNLMPYKNVVSWNAMIAGYVQNHKFDQALYVFHQMLIDGKCKPNQLTMISVLSACSHLGSLEHGKWIQSYVRKNKFRLSIPLGNALVDMFAKCGDVESAKVVFNGMNERCIITWTTMISGLAVNGQCREALALYDQMCFEGISPDDVVFIAVLSACTHGGLVEEGKRVFDQMVNRFGLWPRIEHYGCMVDLLSRVGKVEEAFRFVEQMHLEPNAVIWATLLGACRNYGNGMLVETVIRKILEKEPSNPSYLSLISNMSATSGKWEDALSIRFSMREQDVQKPPGCSLIQVGDRVHEFLAKDTKHEQKDFIYETSYNLNAHVHTSNDLL